MREVDEIMSLVQFLKLRIGKLTPRMMVKEMNLTDLMTKR